MKILALTKYGDRAASTRQRLLQYGDALNSSSISYDFFPLLDNNYIEGLTQREKTSRLDLISAYWARFWILRRARNYDIIWLNYEAFPYLPGLMERLVFRSGKPVVYDFDDAIFHQYDTHRTWLVRKLLGRKLEPLLRRVSICFCGNAYLEKYAAQFCENIVLLPTVVDSDLYCPLQDKAEREILTIGWIGSPSTWAQLRPLIPLLIRLKEKFGFRFKVVGAGVVTEHFPEVEFMDWRQETEISEIQHMDIGIMPLPDVPWARGKCGYKLIQYMACGLPVIASPVGVNKEIVEHGVNGFLASNEPEWEEAIIRLLSDAESRKRMGGAGRAKVEAEYSLRVHAPRLIKALKSIESSDRPCAA